MNRSFLVKLAPLAPLLLAIGALEVLVREQIIPSYLLPAPSQIFLVFQEDYDTLWRAASQTLIASAFGFGLSFVMGISVGIILASHRIFQSTFYPYIAFFQTVPIIAIAPLLVIWFGYGINTVIISSFIVSVFPMIASTLKGLLSTDLALVDL